MTKTTFVDAKIGDVIAAPAPSLRQSGNENWHLLQCVGRSDTQVVDWLKRLNFETYYPLSEEMRPVPRKELSAKQRMAINDGGPRIMRMRTGPLFPRYMFVRFDMSAGGWRDIFKFAGVVGLHCEGGVPVPIADAFIAKCRGEEVAGVIPGKIPMKRLFEIGDRVRVVDGPFCGFDGVVEKLPDDLIQDIDGDTRITIALNVFGRLTPVSFELDQIGRKT